MRVLITGGAGFIGCRLADKLLSLGHEVTAIDSLAPQIHGALPQVSLPFGLTLVRADIRNLGDQVSVFESADAIFHLAAETGTGQSMYQVSQYVSVNELGTASMLEVLSRCTLRPRRIFLASSRSVYGEGAYQDSEGRLCQPDSRSPDALAAGDWELSASNGSSLVPIATPESLPFRPGSVYAATKAAQEMLLLSASQSVRAATAIFRFQNVYGEGQSLRNPYTGIMSIFFNRARQGIGIPLYEDGSPSRDFVHVDDIVMALATSLDADLPHGTVMNLGSGTPTSVLELAHLLVQASGLSVPIAVTGRYRVGDIRHNWADLDRAHALIGYKASVSLADGVRRFVDWAQGQPVYEDLSAQAEQELRGRGLSN